MLCRSCQNQARCLPAQFAQADPALATLLDQLQDCQLQNATLKIATHPQPSFLQVLWLEGRRWWRQVWQSLRRWGQGGRMGSA